MYVVQRGGVSGLKGSNVSRFLRELCGSLAVKRPVTLIARQGRECHDVTGLHRAGDC